MVSIGLISTDRSAANLKSTSMQILPRKAASKVYDRCSRDSAKTHQCTHEEEKIVSWRDTG